MTAISYLKRLIADYNERGQPQVKTENEKIIEEYFETAKMKARIDFILKHEHDNFLYNWGNEK